MTKYLVVALGGALGAVARYWFAALIGERFPTRFPLGTLLINVSGSFIIGFFLTLVTDRLNIHPNWRLAVAVGFVGAYTTFSTFEYETFRLLETGARSSALLNVFLSCILGFLAVWFGIVLAQKFGTPGSASDYHIDAIEWNEMAPSDRALTRSNSREFAETNTGTEMRDPLSND